MPLYTFYPRKPDGVSTSIEAAELDNDQHAMEFAATLLAQHSTCVEVAIWAAERRIGAVRREEPVAGRR